MRAINGTVIRIEFRQRPGHQRRIVRNAVAFLFRYALVIRSNFFSEFISKVIVLSSRSGEIHGAHIHSVVTKRRHDAPRIKTATEVRRSRFIISVSKFHRRLETIIDTRKTNWLRVNLSLDFVPAPIAAARHSFISYLYDFRRLKQEYVGI